MLCECVCLHFNQMYLTQMVVDSVIRSVKRHKRNTQRERERDRHTSTVIELVGKQNYRNEAGRRKTKRKGEQKPQPKQILA